MDTRGKIGPVDGIPDGCTIVTGYFDVVLAADVRELAALRRPIAAIVLPLEGELLPQRARAELAAALRIIDYVALASEGNVPAQSIHLEADQLRRARELKEHVRRRQTR